MRKGSCWKAAVLVAAVTVTTLPSAWAGGAEPPEPAGVDPVTGQTTRPMAEWGRLAAQALLDRSAILVVGTATSRRTETVHGHPHTLTTVAVTNVLRGTAPSEVTVRVEGGILPDGTWEDVEGFAVPLGRPVVVPLHPADRAVGLTPTVDGTYRIDEKLLGLLFGEGGLQPDEPIVVDDIVVGLPPCGTCADSHVHLGAVSTGLADLLATTDDALYQVLSTATAPDVAVCGLVQSELRGLDAAPDGATIVREGCDATGGSQSGDYTTAQKPFWYRSLPTDYRVWNSTPDVVGEEAAVQTGASSWTGTWFSSTYEGLASGPSAPDTAGIVWWAPYDIGHLGVARRDADGWEIVFGDNYCWSRGVKPKCFDIETAARHEMGHILGLGHSTRVENVMFPTVPSGTAKKQGPGDWAGLRYLYPYNDYRGAATIADPADRTVTVTRGRAGEDVTVIFQNVGRTPWNAFRPVRQVTDKPFGRCSIFDGSGEQVPIPLVGQSFRHWTSCSQPVHGLFGPSLASTVESGEEARVTFRFNAPFDRKGLFKESFVLDLPGALHVMGTGHTFTVIVQDLVPVIADGNGVGDLTLPRTAG